MGFDRAMVGSLQGADCIITAQLGLDSAGFVKDSISPRRYPFLQGKYAC